MDAEIRVGRASRTKRLAVEGLDPVGQLVRRRADRRAEDLRGIAGRATQQTHRAFGVPQGRHGLALADLHARGREQDQPLVE